MALDGVSVLRCTVIVFEHLFDVSDIGSGGATSTPASPDPPEQEGAAPVTDIAGRGVECREGAAVRRYDDPVEVRRGWVEGPAHRGEGPEQFLWHGRLWKVRAVLAHWVETGPWWQSSGVQAVIGSDQGSANQGAGQDAGQGVDQGRATTTDLLVERELWRVEAGPGAGRAVDSGVFDLSFDWTAGSWQLVGCVD